MREKEVEFRILGIPWFTIYLSEFKMEWVRTFLSEIAALVSH